jgi:hypothetical protein
MEDDAIFSGPLGLNPHGPDAVGIDLDVVDAAGLGGERGPVEAPGPPPAGPILAFLHLHCRFHAL